MTVGFDPEFDLGHLSRQQLADLGREYMMFAFLLTRSGLGWVHLNLGEGEREQIAILEWMGASPVYTQRMQRALGFVGTEMDTIFKGLQLDVGFAHQYMDVGYNLIDGSNGEFWLKSCGMRSRTTCWSTRNACLCQMLNSCLRITIA